MLRKIFFSCLIVLWKLFEKLKLIKNYVFSNYSIFIWKNKNKLSEFEMIQK